MTAFSSPDTCFTALGADTVASLVAHASDLAVVLDPAGTVRDLSVLNPELSAKLIEPSSWIGQPWLQLLNPASRAKAALLLADTAAARGAAWHHLNHIGRDGGDVPVLYAAALLRPDGDLVLFGRDLRPLSMLQQRLVDAQHTMERDHARLRQLELRYRLVLHTATDPMLVINAATQKIVELNPALVALAGRSAQELTGQSVLDLFAAEDRPRLSTALTANRATAASDAIIATLLDGTRATIAPALFRDESASLLLLRVHPDAAPVAAHIEGNQPTLLQLVDLAPDGYVVTDASGHVISANARFQAMAEVGRPRDLIGLPLDRWLGRGGADLEVLLNNLRQRGSVRLFNTAMTGSSGLSSAVEVSAVALPGAPDGAAFGFALRDIERRVGDSRQARDVPRSVDQLTELIGRVPLKDLVREATDMIERLCIEAALEITRDNRASAAELLGLSRQSLYVKLHRYGLGDLAEAPN